MIDPIFNSRPSELTSDLEWMLQSGQATSEMLAEVLVQEFYPGAYRLGHDGLQALKGGDPAQNAARVRRLFVDPASDPAGRATVALNAGAAIYVAGLAGSPAEGMEQAVAALDEGGAAAALERLVAPGGGNTSA